MQMFHNDFGDTAKTKDEILKKTLEKLGDEGYVECLVTDAAEQVVRWALKFPQFRKDFSGHFQQADKFLFEAHCWEEDTPQ